MARRKANKKQSSLPYHSDIIRVGIEKKLKTREVLFLHTIRSGMNKNNTRNWRSQNTLAKEMRCTRPVVSIVVKELEKKGLIKVTRTDGKSCLYELKIPVPCKESEQGSKKSSQGGVKNLNRGSKKSSQGGVKNLSTNIISDNKLKNKSKGNSSSSIADDDDDTRYYSDLDFQKENKIISSGKKERVSKRFAKKEKEINKLLESRGKTFAKGANYYADGIVERKQIDFALPYKLKILESILAGMHSNFDPEKMVTKMEKKKQRAKELKELHAASEIARKNRKRL